LFLNKL